MTNLLQIVRDYCWLNPVTMSVGNEPAAIATPSARSRGASSGRIAQEEQLGYRSLIELRQQLEQIERPAVTTVVLVLDDRQPVHLPSLIRRDEFAPRGYRLIVTTPARSLLGTTSAGDLALHSQSWGWELIRYEGDLPQALQAARETTAADEQLVVLAPAWKQLRL
ncbi:hypothetical protein NA78x_000066 [Anatilimnocola sp. NA78]|uniref:hypothetical protein n=1 Tax=Anatilimnocola sp. NA78 TaxID=3415683 RepID=UPI003CE4C075